VELTVDDVWQIADAGDQELQRLARNNRRGNLELGAEDNEGLSQRACTAYRTIIPFSHWRHVWYSSQLLACTAMIEQHYTKPVASRKIDTELHFFSGGPILKEVLHQLQHSLFSGVLLNVAFFWFIVTDYSCNSFVTAYSGLAV